MTCTQQVVYIFACPSLCLLSFEGNARPPFSIYVRLIKRVPLPLRGTLMQNEAIKPIKAHAMVANLW